MKISNGKLDRRFKTKYIVILASSLVLIAALVITFSLINQSSSKDQSSNSSSSDKIIENKPANQDVPPTPTVTDKISITPSALGQDNDGGPLVVRTILEGATGGSCTITAAKGLVTKEYSAEVIFSGTYYSCNYTIPYTDLSSGQWQVSVKIVQSDKSGELSQTVNLKD